MINSYWIIAVFLLLAAVAAIYVKQTRRNGIRQLNESAKQAEEKAKEEFLAHAKDFSGYYQSLYDAVSSDNADLTQRMLDIWIRRMEEMPYLKSYFNKILKQTNEICRNGEKWIDIIQSWGMMQDKYEEFVISSEHQILYLFDDVYEMEDNAEVIRPAWFYIDGDRIKCVEQGIARVKESQNG